MLTETLESIELSGLDDRKQVVRTAVRTSGSSLEKQAIAKAAADELTPEQKKDQAEVLYKEATGRFPQNSVDRRLVYQWGIAAAIVVFLITAATFLMLSLSDKDSEAITVIGASAVSGVIGGLFGYARQTD